MMTRRNQRIALLVIGGLLMGSGVAHAQDMVDHSAHPIRKLGRGLANGLGGVLALPLAMHEVGIEKGPVAGCTLGVLLGIGQVIQRTLVGALEIITFPFPLQPYGYEPLLQPEFILEPGSYSASR